MKNSINGEAVFFSVVIPAYNVEQHIIKTLDSVTSQTYSNYEIVITDDGSIDKTTTRIKNFFLRHRNIDWKVITQKNKGIGGARNTGIKNAKGDYVAFLDADDIWYPDKLFLTHEYIQHKGNIDLLCHDEVLIKYGQNKGVSTYGPYSTYKELLFNGNSISTSATVVKRSKLLKVGLFSENMNFNGVEDYELWLRLSKICNIEYLHEVLGEYHVHGAGITSNISKQLKNILNVIDHCYLSWPTKNFYYNCMINKARSNAIRGAGRNFQRNGEYKTAKKYLFQALFTYPLSIKNIISIVFCYLRIKI